VKRPSLIALPCALALGLSAFGGLPADASRTDPNPTPSELAHAALAREAGGEAMILLENAGALPVPVTQPVALFGVGSYRPVKGGFGSGDVYNRAVVNVHDGLVAAGYQLTTSPAYWDAMTGLVDTLITSAPTSGPMTGVWDMASAEIAITPASAQPTQPTDTAIIVVARNSGEGEDRSSGKGAYQLTDVERANIKVVAGAYSQVIVLLNTGGIVDTAFYGQINAAIQDPAGGQALDALLLMSQLGGETGYAVADVVSGAVNPSGKTVSTWASAYSYYPAAGTFSMQDGNAAQENYTEGIYVGYRYFDSFYRTINPANPASVVAYPFGYGGSYTSFSVKTDSVTADAEQITVKATVANTGKVAGKQVVQAYFSAPQNGLDKPYQELGAYAKTDLLAPGKAQQLTLSFPVTEMSSYSEELAAYILQAGDYIIRVGDHSRSTAIGAIVQIDQTVLTEQLSNQVKDEVNPYQLESDPANFYSYPAEAAQLAAAPRINVAGAQVATANNASTLIQTVAIPSTSPFYAVDGSPITATTALINAADAADWEGTGSPYPVKEGETTRNVTVAGTPTLYDAVKGTATWDQLIASLSTPQLLDIVQGVGMFAVSAASTYHATGAVGYTTAAQEASGIPAVTMADGPAGLRLTKEYSEAGQDYYQYATAWPVGIAMAQTWNRALVEAVGDAIGEEMEEYGVTIWLAPGVNIHRDPLNGRNFEYYSEDPLLTGLTAAAVTAGIQSHPGRGVTMKHYAGNNQETNRSGGNATIDERALREIYLKGFEIAVKQAQPMAFMTSYGKINGRCVAGDYDLTTNVLRGEWDFAGVVMTDWGGCGPFLDNMYAGNDLIMPGGNPASANQSILIVPPSVDVFGLPSYIHQPAGMIVIPGFGTMPGQESYTFSTGNFVLAAGGGVTFTTTVDASISSLQPNSGDGTGAMFDSPPVLETPLAPFADPQAAYDHIQSILALPTSIPGTFTAAQKAGIEITNVVGTSPNITSFDVVLSGDYYAPGRLGDLQRSALHVLQTWAQTAPFADLAQRQNVSGITVAPYSAQFDDLVSYATTAAGPVVDAEPSTSRPVPAQDKTGLAAVIDAAAALGGAAAFTASSWQGLQAALASARTVAGDPNATQAQVDGAANAVKAALKALAVVTPYDHSAMEAAIAALAKAVEALKTEPVKDTPPTAVKAGTVKISGQVKVGKKLTAKTAGWTSGVKFTYRWYAGGKAIKKATAKTFKVTKALVGKKLTVKVTARKTGLTTASKTSKATAKVKR
jgi:beta-glucosidase